MPRLCDITEPGKPCKVMFLGTEYRWDGSCLYFQGFRQDLSSTVLHDTRWSLVPEETIESLCKDAGFNYYMTSNTLGYHHSGNEIWYTVGTTIPQVKKIIAFAQEMKQCNK